MKRFAQYLLPVLGMAAGMVSAAAQLTPRTILVVLSKQYPDNSLYARQLSRIH
jgi:hypothetical protein